MGCIKEHYKEKYNIIIDIYAILWLSSPGIVSIFTNDKNIMLLGFGIATIGMVILSLVLMAIKKEGS